MATITVRAADEADRRWMARLLSSRWGAVQIVSRGQVHQADRLPAYVAVRDGEPVGLATYRAEGEACELVSLDSLEENTGVGTALLEAVRRRAENLRCRRLWLVTTNDNLRALGFYQRRDFVLVAVHRNAMDAVRRLKPTVPAVGLNGIPLRDELELECKL
jgi:DNA-3-methyladenine glycosylase I